MSLNPDGKIPAILDPDGPDGQPLALSESGAILLYLADRLRGEIQHASGYLPQSVNFHGNVHVGDVLTARVTVTELDPATGKIGLQTDCFVGDKHVLGGKAVMRLPRRPA